MPYYFGYSAREGKPSGTTVNIGSKTYDKAQPSMIKMFPMISAHSILTSTWSSIVALWVAVFSMKAGMYTGAISVEESL